MSKILALDVGGIPNRWINREEACVYYAKSLVAWEVGEDVFMFRGGENRITGTQSRIVTAPIIAVKGESKGAKRMNRIPSLNNRDLFQRDRHICAYCGNLFRDAKLTRDHVHPVSKGGRDIWTNVVTACNDCNHWKGDKTLEQADLQLLYVPYAPNSAEGLLLEERNILACQMEYLEKWASADFKSRDVLVAACLERGSGKVPTLQ